MRSVGHLHQPELSSVGETEENRQGQRTQIQRGQTADAVRRTLYRETKRQGLHESESSTRRRYHRAGAVGHPAANDFRNGDRVPSMNAATFPKSFPHAGRQRNFPEAVLKMLTTIKFILIKNKKMPKLSFIDPKCTENPASSSWERSSSPVQKELCEERSLFSDDLLGNLPRHQYIREFETMLSASVAHYIRRRHLYTGPAHLYTGQEAQAVGMATR